MSGYVVVGYVGDVFVYGHPEGFKSGAMEEKVAERFGVIAVRAVHRGVDAYSEEGQGVWEDPVNDFPRDIAEMIGKQGSVK